MIEMSQHEFETRLARLTARHLLDFPDGPLTTAELILALRRVIVDTWAACEATMCEECRVRSLVPLHRVPTLYDQREPTPHGN